MKLKNSYFYTLREDCRDEDSLSGNLLCKAGFIKKLSAGIYMMLPLGLKVEENIEKIIRKHMNEKGAQEVKMPALIDSIYYEESGRLKGFGPSVFKLQDRNKHDFVLGPTHEEIFAFAANSKIKSYKDMPFNLYQFQTKYRDEPRARFGLIRVKEFVMKDAYSFDTNEENLDISYKKMFDAYKDSFDELGLDYKIVKADTGIMGGLLSEEFQAISPIGEDNICYCECGYSSNNEIAEVITDDENNNEYEALKEVNTGNASTIEEVCKFLKEDIKNTVKALLMNIDGKLTIFFIRGDRELNESKVLKQLKASEINFADDNLIATSNAIAGYTGPIGLNTIYYVDNEVLKMRNFIVGANKKGYHYINANIKDFDISNTGDFVIAKDGDLCPKCHKKLKFTKGIEVGNTFKLGTKYSKAMNLTYLSKDNKEELVWMGSYGIGIGRTMAAIVEQNHDENGIVWPKNIAPYKAIILIMSTNDQEQLNLANKLYELLKSNNIEVILDDRDERAGVKFNDADLIGIPYRITVGRSAKDGIVEFKERQSKDSINISLDEVLNKLK